ncbi:MAG: EF-Tu/IF-2/RF-3 family GTPase [Candidatus Methanospirareceae archaeon]
MLDAFNISRGIILVPPYTELTKIAAITQSTALEHYAVLEQDIPMIQKTLEGFEISRDTRVSAQIVVDHSFPVKGVGEVVLGSVKQGLVRRHDKLLALPQGTEVVVRSIQMQDNDVLESEAGSRIGLAIKGATAEAMKRGTVICAPGSAAVDTNFALSFVQNRYYATGLKEGAYHLSIGMQTVPVNVTAVGAETVTLVTQRPVAYSADDTFLLLDLNAAKVHVIGRGHCQELPE